MVSYLAMALQVTFKPSDLFSIVYQSYFTTNQKTQMPTLERISVVFFEFDFFFNFDDVGGKLQANLQKKNMAQHFKVTAFNFIWMISTI